ncbi:MAG: hypothetical protein ACLT1I_12365 [Mediterraneibacter faecis]
MKSFGYKFKNNKKEELWLQYESGKTADKKCEHHADYQAMELVSPPSCEKERADTRRPFSGLAVHYRNS